MKAMHKAATISVVQILPPTPKVSFSGPVRQVAEKYRRIFGSSNNGVHYTGNAVCKLENITLKQIDDLFPAETTVQVHSLTAKNDLTQRLEARGLKIISSTLHTRETEDHEEYEFYWDVVHSNYTIPA